MCLARSQNVLLVPRQHVEGRVARSRNGFVEDLRPPGRDLPNILVGHQRQVDCVQALPLHPVRGGFPLWGTVVEQRLVGRVRAVDEQRRIALVRGDVAAREDRR